MKIFRIFYLLFLASCAFKIDPPVEFQFQDKDIVANAKFYKFYKEKNMCFGKMLIKNNNPEKRILINTIFLEGGKKFIRIYPDSIMYVGINIRRMQSFTYDVITEGNCLDTSSKDFSMKIGYDLQNDSVPSFQSK